MIYFSPIYDEWFEYLGDNNLNYQEYCNPWDMRYDAVDETIIDKWNNIPIPPAPELKSVEINPQNTALLILDIENSICKSPHCIDSVNYINNLLTRARKNEMLVVYSLIPNGTTEDVDCMSSENPYAEQYTAWHMINSPGTRNRAILTKANLINFSQS